MSELTIEERVSRIEARNRAVETDKAWERSWTRRLTIAVLTYFTVAVYLQVIGSPAVAASALVPAGGYLLSTLALPVVRRRWQR